MTSEKKQCPYCGELIASSAKKCRFCGAWLNEEQQVPCPCCGELISSLSQKCEYCGEYVNQQNKYPSSTSNFSQDSTLYQIQNMQKISNTLWKVFSVLMIVVGFISVVFSGNADFRSGFGEEQVEIIIQGVFLIALGVYNLIQIPNELPEKIVKQDKYVIEYYKDITSFVVAGVINLLLCFIGVFLIGFDLYIRHVVMKNEHLFERDF